MVDAVSFRSSIVPRVADHCDGSRRLVSRFENNQLDK